MIKPCCRKCWKARLIPLDPDRLWFSYYYSASQTLFRAHPFTTFIEIYIIRGVITNWYGSLGRIDPDQIYISMDNRSLWSIMTTIYSHLLHDKMQKFQESFILRTGLSHYKTCHEKFYAWKRCRCKDLTFLPFWYKTMSKITSTKSSDARSSCSAPIIISKT